MAYRKQFEQQPDGADRLGAARVATAFCSASSLVRLLADTAAQLLNGLASARSPGKRTTNLGANMKRASWTLAALILVALGSGCGSSAPAETGGGNSTAGPAQKAVKFAECMRHNGVSQFPDPGPSGRLTIDAVANGSGLDPSTPAFTQAVSACKNLEPPGFMGTKRSAAQQQAALRFAQCIRANGVKDFPDPLPNGPLIDTTRIPSVATGSGMSSLHAAMQTCAGAAAAAGITR